jgi:hypothetical protein
MELLISSRAEADLVSAFDWYQKKGADLGGDFVRCADATISLIHVHHKFSENAMDRCGWR